MDKYKKSRGILKGKFTRKCKLLENRLKANDPYEVLQGIYDELSVIFKDIEVINDSIIDMLNENASYNASGIEEAENYIDQLEMKKTEMRVAVVKCKSTNNTSSVKVKSLPHPIFSGDIRKFGTFTKDYDRLMTPIYGRDPYALLKCLSGDALECVQGVEDDFDSMIIRLQALYGNPCKITDSIVKDIKMLDIIPEGDSVKFIHSVNVLERAWLDMSKLNLEKEMNTTSMVTLVERILPRKLCHDWVRISGKLVDKS